MADRLRDALARLYVMLPAEAIAHAFRTLTRLEGPTLAPAQEKATQTVLGQAEGLSEVWMGEAA